MGQARVLLLRPVELLLAVKQVREARQAVEAQVPAARLVRARVLKAVRQVAQPVLPLVLKVAPPVVLRVPVLAESGHSNGFA